MAVFLTLGGTAYLVALRAGRAHGMVKRPAPRGGIAVWRKARGTSVYLAYPGSDYLVEVYDPIPARTQSLALSGSVKPVL